MYTIQEIFAHEITNCTDPDADWYIVVDKDGHDVYAIAMPKEEAQRECDWLNEDRLEEIRLSIREGDISYGEIFELQSLVDLIDTNDVELLQWAKSEEL
jgi:hypothetical protein